MPGSHNAQFLVHHTTPFNFHKTTQFITIIIWENILFTCAYKLE